MLYSAAPRGGAVAGDTTTVDGGAARLLNLANEPGDGRNDDTSGGRQLHYGERFEHAFICVHLEKWQSIFAQALSSTTEAACC